MAVNLSEQSEVGCWVGFPDNVGQRRFTSQSSNMGLTTVLSFHFATTKVQSWEHKSRPYKVSDIAIHTAH